MNLPPEFISSMRAQLQDEFAHFEGSLQAHPPTSIRLNKSKIKDELSLPIQKRVRWNSDGFYLDSRPSFTLDPLYHGGAYYVQEASSMFVKEAVCQWIALDERPLRILDLCAAPGGKSTILADLGSKHLLVSNEVIRSRFHVLNENLERWGSVNKLITNHDVDDFEALSGYFDLVLVDAPCSGEGLFRKDPNACNEWSNANVKLCANRQKRILAGAQNLVAPGGVLIYCTCTYNNQENIDNVSWLNKEFELTSMNLKLENTWNIQEISINKCFGYQFYPHKIQGEGFFIAGLRKWEGSDFSIRKKKKMKGYFQEMSKKDQQELNQFVELDLQHQYFIDPHQNLFFIDRYWWNDIQLLTSILRKNKPGVELGVLKNGKFIPHHALAMATDINHSFPLLPVDKKSALQFLKKETFETNVGGLGWYVVQYQGLNLGWVKLLGNRMNNYLPKNLRIRMQITNVD